MSVTGWSEGPRLAYLAAPYRHHLRGRVGAYIEASEVAAKLMQTGGIHLFCAVAHMHPMVMHGALELEQASSFEPVNARFLQLCDVLIVARLSGWEQSEGIAEAVAQFQRGPPWRPIFDAHVRWNDEGSPMGLRVVLARRDLVLSD